ncbi:hypothetical protein AB433_16880 [Croceicoccus naphthovorans]|uniref:Uncharacterized protein n=1 Tax=Croceicoccus naphthovorans TaxID=1348774 RepID=A0A0G3XLG4_9SPHN|nr:hypothetical protein AB433_16880 [Croceicoccus naphthovorans]
MDRQGVAGQPPQPVFQRGLAQGQARDFESIAAGALGAAELIVEPLQTFKQAEETVGHHIPFRNEWRSIG